MSENINSENINLECSEKLTETTNPSTNSIKHLRIMFEGTDWKYYDSCKSAAEELGLSLTTLYDILTRISAGPCKAISKKKSVVYTITNIQKFPIKIDNIPYDTYYRAYCDAICDLLDASREKAEETFYLLKLNNILQ